MTHYIVWTHNRDHVEASAVCDDQDCIHRYACPHLYCEVYHDLRREPDGTVTHKLLRESKSIPYLADRRHQLEKVDYCTGANHLNAEPGILPELSEDTYPFEIGRTSVDLTRDYLGVLWKRVAPAAQQGGTTNE